MSTNFKDDALRAYQNRLKDAIRGQGIKKEEDHLRDLILALWPGVELPNVMQAHPTDCRPILILDDVHFTITYAHGGPPLLAINRRCKYCRIYTQSRACLTRADVGRHLVDFEPCATHECRRESLDELLERTDIIISEALTPKQAAMREVLREQE